MDLSSLTDADFEALQRGDLKGMSEAGFASLLKAQEASLSKPERDAKAVQIAKDRYDPLKDMNPGKKFAAGVGQAVTNAGRAIAQAMPGSGVTREQIDQTRREDAPLLADPYGRAGSMTGTAAIGAGTMLLPGAGTVLGATAYGGALGALAPLGTGEGAGTVARNALAGAASGGGAAVAGNAITGLLAPKVRAPAASLMREGVELTPGMRAGGGFKRMEDALTSMPVVGDVVRNAQNRAFETFGSAVANRALAPINAKLPAGVTGRDAVAYTERALGDAYDSVLRQVGHVRSDPQMLGELVSLKNMVRTSPMPAEVKAQFDSVISNQITGKLQGQGAMTAETFKGAESELGRLAAKYGADASADKQLLGDALQEAQAIMRRTLERSSSPQVAAEAKAANAGWAEFKRMQRAASMTGSRGGVFSPEAYLSAVRALDPSKDKGAFARGNALGQALGDDAVATMGRTIPDSGTPFRTLATRPFDGAVNAIIGSPIAAVYSRPVQNALQLLASGKRPALATRAAAELEMARPAINALAASYGAANSR